MKKSSSIDPETPERSIISVFKSYLVHLGSFKRHILYFCASIVENIRSHRREPHEAMFVVVSVLQTDQMWPLMWSPGFHFCLLKFFSQRCTFDGYLLNDIYVKRVPSIQPWTTNGEQRRVKLICDMTSDCLQQSNLSSAWNQKEKSQQSFVVQEVA